MGKSAFVTTSMRPTLVFILTWVDFVLGFSITLSEGKSTLKIPDIKFIPHLSAGSDYDVVIVVAPSIAQVKQPELRKALSAVAKVDRSANRGLFIAPCPEVAGNRVVYSSTGSLDQDIDDVRRFGDAMERGIKRALQAGAKAPLLAMYGTEAFPRSELVSILGAFEAMYVPLAMREPPFNTAKVNKFGIFVEKVRIAKEKVKLTKMLQLVTAIEEGRTVTRDIGGADPERMAPPRVEEYCKILFQNDTSVKVEVIEGQERLQKEYPCMAAVNRGANTIPRHRGRVIWLTYTPKGPVTQTLMIVGKGITYDTGGANIKIQNLMAGMSRDKCGAAMVAGFIKTVSELKPKGLKVVAAMAMVRNSIGANSYVADEIITSRSGVRLRVTNTDKEGRMAMVDVLCHMREKALKETNPHLMTFATLTGAAERAVGSYTAIIDNGPAQAEGFSRAMFETGEKCGDEFGLANLRREDYQRLSYVTNDNVNVDVVQLYDVGYKKQVSDAEEELVDLLQDTTSSSANSRGYQSAAAFLNVVSGLNGHQTRSAKPLKYTHFDIAGSAYDKHSLKTTGRPLTAMTMHFVEPKM